MTLILAIFLGIALGWILYKIEDKYPKMTYLIGVLPYSIFFWLSLDDREFWGPYRMIALFGSIVALISWKLLESFFKQNKVES